MIDYSAFPSVYIVYVDIMLIGWGRGRARTTEKASLVENLSILLLTLTVL
jgi:hypothetical protein